MENEKKDVFYAIALLLMMGMLGYIAVMSGKPQRVEVNVRRPSAPVYQPARNPVPAGEKYEAEVREINRYWAEKAAAERIRSIERIQKMEALDAAAE